MESLVVNTTSSRRRQPNSHQLSSGYQLTELRNVASNRDVDFKMHQHRGVGDAHDDEELARRVIEHVKMHPCIYDPSNKQYGDRPNQQRAMVWSDIAHEIDFQDGESNDLQRYWERLRERFLHDRRVRKRRQRHISDVLLSDGIFEAMLWLDTFIDDDLDEMGDDNEVHEPPSQHLVDDLELPPDMYYLASDGDQTENDVMLTGYQISQRLPVQEAEFQGHHGHVSDDNRGATESPASEISVGSNGTDIRRDGRAEKAVKGGMKRAAATQLVAHSTAHGIRVEAAEPSVSYVTKVIEGESQQPQMIGNIKKGESQAGYMLVDSGASYAGFDGAEQKVYRLINVGDDGVHTQDITLSSLQQSSGPPRRKRIALVPAASLQSVHIPESEATFSTSRGGRLGDDLILDDGVHESTVVIDNNHYSAPEATIEIDNNGSPIPILDDSPGMSSMLIGGHQQLMSSSDMRQHTDRRSPSVDDAVYSQYDADVQFQALIASHLSRLNDEQKAVMKFNIQRILLDARLGAGAGARIIQEEEQELAAAEQEAGGDIVTHELVSTLPH